MVAQAEHIPVHLGAMPTPVAAVLEHDPGPDDVFILNDPYAGGTHLPDITLVSRTELGFAATRAHHADVGGAEPGSMPAGSRTLAEEGVVIPPTRLDEEALDGARRADAQPGRAARRPPRAARRAAARASGGSRSSAPAAAATRCRRRWTSSSRTRSGASARGSPRCPTGATRRRTARGGATGELELRVAVTIAGDELEIDFAGNRASARRQPQLPARRHAVRVPVRRPLPDRPGRARVGRRVRAGDRPRAGRAVSSTRAAGGGRRRERRDLEPDRRRPLRRVRAGASPVPAQGQGTMNNVVLGNERFTYYETIGGGQGACPDADGPSGVHVAMSNTLSTPTEALELAYPLRVERHELRLGSGGAGRHRGGDGVVRELRVLEGCRLSLLTQRRRDRARRSGRRRGRAAGAQPRERRGAAGVRVARARRRRRRADRDAGRRRLRREPVERVAPVLVDGRASAVHVEAVAVDDEPAGTGAARDAEVAGGEELDAPPCAARTACSSPYRRRDRAARSRRRPVRRPRSGSSSRGRSRRPRRSGTCSRSAATRPGVSGLARRSSDALQFQAACTTHREDEERRRDADERRRANRTTGAAARGRRRPPRPRRPPRSRSRPPGRRARAGRRSRRDRRAGTRSPRAARAGARTTRKSAARTPSPPANANASGQKPAARRDCESETSVGERDEEWRRRASRAKTASAPPSANAAQRRRSASPASGSSRSAATATAPAAAEHLGREAVARRRDEVELLRVVRDRAARLTRRRRDARSCRGRRAAARRRTGRAGTTSAASAAAIGLASSRATSDRRTRKPANGIQRKIA